VNQETEREDMRRACAGLARIAVSTVLVLLGGCGLIVERDGPGRSISSNDIRDAVPRKEPRSKYGNPESYVVLGKRYHTMKTARGYTEKGIASWYGKKFHGRKTSSGEVYDMYKMTAAHKSLPLPTYVQVRNVNNNRTAVVKVNDRGPFHENRIIDLSYAAALKLNMASKGTAFVEIRALDERGKPTGPVLAGAAADPGISSGVYLQIGAFSDRGNAVRLSDQVADVVPNSVHIREVSGNGQSLYRVQIGPIVSVDIADGLVALLGQLGITQHYFVVN
jgi:rare lipoprotein A